MWPGLDQLLQLQTLDLAIAKVEAELASIPKAIEVVEGRLVTARQDFEAATGKIEQVQKERRVKERELEEVNQNAKKKQVRLFEIKTNDEYTAVLKEIEALKTKASALETQILEQMEQGDVTAKILADAQRVFQAAQAACQQERREKEARQAALQQELAGLAGTRASQAGRIDGDLLRQYARLMKSRDVAVVPVLEGSCSGCGMALTPQAFTEIRRSAQVFICPACIRILYFAG
jgi:predicted  nucleic acid-binding Zn-ribbon protein